MTKIAIIGAPNSAHQWAHAHAVLDGLRKIGTDSDILSSIREVRDHSLIFVWGWRLGQMLRSQGKEVVVMERGYIGDRFSWTSLAANGLNGNGAFPTYADESGDRLDHYHPGILRPWRGMSGDRILIMGQVPGDASLRGQDLSPWYVRQARLAREKFSLPVFFREHPNLIKKGCARKVPFTDPSNGTLEEDLARAAMVITFNSNSGVDSVLAGIPTVVFDKGSMAWSVKAGDEVTLLQNEHLQEPAGRKVWAQRLAWCQWTMDEIATGKPLQAFMSLPLPAGA